MPASARQSLSVAVGRTLLRYRLTCCWKAPRWSAGSRCCARWHSRFGGSATRACGGWRCRNWGRPSTPGQILSTRRDLVPPDIAEELALQDQVAPFEEPARHQIEAALASVESCRRIR